MKGEEKCLNSSTLPEQTRTKAWPWTHTHTQLRTRCLLLRYMGPGGLFFPIAQHNKRAQTKSTHPTNADVLPAAPASLWLCQPGAWWMVIFVWTDSLGGDGSISGGSQDDLFPARSHSISRGAAGRPLGPRCSEWVQRSACGVQERTETAPRWPPSSAWWIKLKSPPSHLEAMTPSITAKPTQVRDMASHAKLKAGSGGEGGGFVRCCVYTPLSI